MNKKRIDLKIDSEIYKNLKKLAIERNIKIGDCLSEIIKFYLDYINGKDIF